MSGNVKQALIENIINILREEADRSECYIEATIIDRKTRVIIIEWDMITDKEKLKIEGYGEVEIMLGEERTVRVYKDLDVTLSRRNVFIDTNRGTYEVGYLTLAKTKDGCFYQISLNDPAIESVAEYLAESTQA